MNKMKKRKTYQTRSKYRKCEYCKEKFEPMANGAKIKYCSDECAKDMRRKRNRERWREQNPGWNDDREVTLECEWCGGEYQVLKRYAYQSQYCSDECGQESYSRQVRGNIPLEEMERIWEKQSRLTKQRNERRKAINNLKRSLSKVIKYHEEIERVQELTRECVECGSVFYNRLPHALTCSSRCSRKRGNRLSRMYSRGRLNKDNIVDDDITLERLYKRDEGVCHLCGGGCNYDDATITDEGYYVVGKTHPSIDHVKPISKGGKHSWDNVKLACFYCNTIKSDNAIESTQKTLA